MRVVGVDPGFKGAIALLENGKLIRIEDMPVFKLRRGKGDKNEIDGYTLSAILREMKPDLGCVEQVGGITGESASSSFNFGFASGAPGFIMMGMLVRVEKVPPIAWRKALKVNPGKDGSRFSAMKFWPSMSESFKLKKHDGRAEAALIAQYAYTHYGKPRKNIFD